MSHDEVMRVANIFLLFIAGAAASAANGADTELESRHAGTAALIVELIESQHYSRPILDDRGSDALLYAYLDALDPYRDIFTAKDVAGFNGYRHSLDDGLRNGELSAVSEIFALFLQRLDDRLEFVTKRLAEQPEPPSIEGFDVRNNEAAWARSVQELDEIWAQRLQLDVATLRVAGHEPNSMAGTLRTRYVQLRKRYRDFDADDIFHLFINAYLSTVDPHSGYFLPRTRRRPSSDEPLEGIGVQLRTEKEYVAIRRIFAGGAADRSGVLEQGDRILAVDRGDAAGMTDVVGWTLDDVVDLIRGPAGSTVRLQVLSRGAGWREPPGEVVLARDKIRLEELRARRSSTATVPRKDREYRIGVIAAPSFYIDYAAYGRGATNFPSTARDVERLINELQAEAVDGIIIDLRGNRGGALLEANRLMGLFIESGPVVQVKKGSGELEVQRDPDPRLVYDGPLVVLVDRNSASSSEIFAAAIQDYGRGLIIGERSYGKGTVQQTFDLNSGGGRYGQTIGQLVLTIAEYFRVTGESTQLRGVTPDIELPATLRPGDYGERTERNPLPWEKVPPVDFQATPGSVSVTSALIERHETRLENSTAFAEGMQTLARRAQAGGDAGVVMTRERWRDVIRHESSEILADLIESTAPAEEAKP